MSVDLRASLDRLVSVAGLPPAESAEPFPGLGLDNTLLRATLVGGHEVLLRQMRPGPSPLRRHRFLEPLGAPRMWAADDGGASLVDFVPGEPLAAVAAAGRLDDVTWRLLGQAFARVHAVRFAPTLQGPYSAAGLTLISHDPAADLLEAVAAAEGWVRTHRPHLADQVPVLRRRIEVNADRLRGRESALLHGDANFHNVVVGLRSVVLIDWDVPEVGDPVRELAGLEGHAYLHGFRELPSSFHDGYGADVPRDLLRLYRIVGHLQVLSSPGWARMVSGAADLPAPVVAMLRGFYDGWSDWVDDLSGLLKGW